MKFNLSQKTKEILQINKLRGHAPETWNNRKGFKVVLKLGF